MEINKIYLMLTPFFPTAKSYRGSYIYDQVRAIERSGKFNKVVVVVPCSFFGSEKNFVFGGVSVVLSRQIKLPSMLFPSLFNWLNTLMFLQRLKSADVNLKDVCVAHIHTVQLAFYAHKLRVCNPKIYTIIQYHNLDPFNICVGAVSRWVWHQRFFVKQMALSVSCFDLHVGVSSMVIQQLKNFPKSKIKSYEPYNKKIKKLQGLKPVQINDSCVLYNGVDENKFFMDRFCTSMKKDFVIGCIGNFTDRKSQITLLKAVKLIKQKKVISNLKVVLVGSGPLLSECENYVLNNDLVQEVSFEKEVAHTELRSFFYGLDLFVLPSVFEGFGCVFLEAYSCGVPFICVEGQGISEYIFSQDSLKWVVPPFDHVELGGRIVSYYLNRYEQKLKYTVNIDALVREFLDIVESKRMKKDASREKHVFN